MTKAQRAALARYVARLSGRLDLMEWRVRIGNEPLAEDAVASIQPVTDRRVATLCVEEGFLDYSRDTIRRTLIHELLHLAHHEVAEGIRTFGESGAVARPVFEVVWERFRQGEEVMVDRLAYAVAAMVDDDDDPDLRILKPEPEGKDY